MRLRQIFFLSNKISLHKLVIIRQNFTKTRPANLKIYAFLHLLRWNPTKPDLIQHGETKTSNPQLIRDKSRTFWKSPHPFYPSGKQSSDVAAIVAGKQQQRRSTAEHRAGQKARKGPLQEKYYTEAAWDTHKRAELLWQLPGVSPTIITSFPCHARKSAFPLFQVWRVINDALPARSWV